MSAFPSTATRKLNRKTFIIDLNTTGLIQINEWHVWKMRLTETCFLKRRAQSSYRAVHCNRNRCREVQICCWQWHVFVIIARIIIIKRIVSVSLINWLQAGCWFRRDKQRRTLGKIARDSQSIVDFGGLIEWETRCCREGSGHVTSNRK